MKNQIAETERRRFPSFDCPNPNCKAKNIAFAPSAETKNRSELIPIEALEEIDDAEFIVNCPKCRRQFALIRHHSYPVIPLELIPYLGSYMDYLPSATREDEVNYVKLSLLDQFWVLFLLVPLFAHKKQNPY